MLGDNEFGPGRSTSVEMVEDGTAVTLTCPVSGIDDPVTGWFFITTNSSGIAVETPINTSDSAYTLE